MADKPNAKVTPVPNQAQVQKIRCAVVPADLLSQIVDFIRDTPASRKQTDPIMNGLQAVQYADFPVNNPVQQDGNAA